MLIARDLVLVPGEVEPKNVSVMADISVMTDTFWSRSQDPGLWVSEGC
jgi:hypothetical protein